MRNLMVLTSMLFVAGCGSHSIQSELSDSEFQGLLSGQKVTYTETRESLFNSITPESFQVGNYPIGDPANGLLSWSVHPGNLSFKGIKTDLTGATQDKGPELRIPNEDVNSPPPVLMQVKMAILPPGVVPAGNWTFNVSIHFNQQRFQESQMIWGSHWIYGLECQNAAGDYITNPLSTVINNQHASNDQWEAKKIDMILEDFDLSKCATDLKLRMALAMRGFQFLKMNVQMLSLQQ